MGYYIRPNQTKKKLPHWKVQFVSYKKSDIEKSTAKNPKKEWDVPRERWRALGFSRHLTFEEAKARAKQLNSMALLKKQERKLRLLKLEQLELCRKNDAFLPTEFVEEFEWIFLRKRDVDCERNRRRFAQLNVVWKATQKLILHVKVDPSEWFCNSELIYDYFYEKKFSLSYIHKIISIMNLWGYFISRKLELPFMAVRRPRGYERQRMIDNYYLRIGNKKRASAPLKVEILEAAKDKLKPEQFNWLYISVWLGLRPQEVENVKNSALWKKDELPTGTAILWVFQTKLVTLPPDDRWKPIPLLHDEQRIAFEMVKSGKFEKPLIKTIKKYCGPGISLYGGRKGFTDLMLEKGHSIEAISQWMGHSTISRTWRTYKSRRGITFSLPKTA